MRRLFRRLAVHLIHVQLPCLKEDITAHLAMRALSNKLYRPDRYRSLQTRLRTRFYDNDIMLDQLAPDQCYLVEVVLAGERDKLPTLGMSVAVYHLGDEPKWTPYHPVECGRMDGRFFFALHEGRLNKVCVKFGDTLVRDGRKPVVVYRPGWDLAPMQARLYG